MTRSRVGSTADRRVVVAACVAVAAATAALAADVWRSRDGDGIGSKREAVEATAKVLQGDLREPRVARVALVEEAHELQDVAPDISPGAFGRKGFPGAVWVVIVTGRFSCEGEESDARLPFVFDAATGRPLVQSGRSCDFLVPNVHVSPRDG